MTARRWTAALALSFCLPLLACQEDDGEIDLEPGPATQGVPGAAGEITPGTWDTDLDDRVNREEFDAWWTEQEQAGTPPGVEADRNGDGVVSEEERREAWFDHLDSDGDGALDAAEREAVDGGSAGAGG